MKAARFLTITLLLVTGCLSPRVEIRFSPEGGAEAVILEQIATAKKTLDIAMFSFTSVPIADALVAAHDRGVRVRVILDGDQAKSKHSVHPYLEAHGIPVMIEQNPGLMHDKFMVVDEAIVITGSYNFTWSAEHRNDENLLVIHDRPTALQYQERFEILMNHFNSRANF